jgi:hypothetical protein
MKQYNRALDYTVLALSELKKGNSVTAAKLMAAAANQKDVTAAIRILEASNKQAFVGAKRLKANEEFPFEDGDVEAGDEMGDMDMDTDPLDEIESAEDEMVEDEMMGDEEPGVAMAKVLSKMVKRSSRR